MTRFFRLVFVFVFFFGLPYLVYREAYFFTDRYFRWHMIPYPSENFAFTAGLGASFWMLGLSFLVHGIFFKKRR